MSGNEGIRINKYLSEMGICSRREADKLIEQGRIFLNGRIPLPGAKVRSGDKVKVDGRLVTAQIDAPIYLAFNKPVGIVCTTDTKEKDNIIDYIKYPKRIFPIGRLDKPSEGLIFLTSNGDIVNKILRAGNQHEKEYVVTVNKEITDDFIQKMGNGVPILGQTTKKCKVEKINPYTFKIVLKQGLNRQIRRMCEFFSYEVLRLKRTRIMHIELDIPSGQWRDLTDQELEQLLHLVEGSSKTQKNKNTKTNKKPSSSSPSKGKYKAKAGKKHPQKPKNRHSKPFKAKKKRP